MAGSVREDNGAGRSSEGISSGQRCQSGDSLSEWRSSEQVENGTPSTSPPYWDTDSDDDCSAKPSELYGRFTWKIEKFSQINKRELRSNPFEVGGYKWYILIYPQGCDVCNHLSLFLCVANHDKLLPGWSHFAQFTIAVVNKDPKKSKYSDTLHRFWKKEHDWGWKKFMELTKVSDGFIVSDTLVIKAQVQVIREKAHRPFRCLDCQYRRELVRVYLSNVELICRRFVEEKRGVLGNLIEDKVRWSSFRAFWLGVDRNVRQQMSRDKTDAILKDVVKSFFIEKEVTSTLVMDSLYSGLRALESQNKNKKGMVKSVEMEEIPAPIVFVEKDMFVLADDVLLLLQRAANEPLPPKDDKGPQNRMKDGSSGDDFSKDSIERDERRLTELGRRTVEIFVLAQIFSGKIEAAYQEAVALKRQEELIREEEAAGQAESELKAKHGATEKEKRAKKKQSKQKRKSRKGKDKRRDVKCTVMGPEHQRESPSVKITLVDFSLKQARSILDQPSMLEDVSDVSDDGDDVAETPQHDSEDRDGSPGNWDTDTSEIHPYTEASSSASSLPVHNGGVEKKSPSTMDDSSSTCSTDSVPSVVMNGPYKGNSLPSNKSQTSPSRGKNQHQQNRRAWTVQGNVKDNQHSYSAVASRLHDQAGSCTGDAPESEAVSMSLKGGIDLLELHLHEKLQKKRDVNGQTGDNRPSKLRTAEAPFSPSSPTRNMASSSQPKQAAIENTTPAVLIAGREATSKSPSQSGKTVPTITRSPQSPAFSRQSEVQKPTSPVKGPIEMSTTQVSAISRPSSAPVVPVPRPNAPVVSVVQTSPLLSRSVSAAGRLGTDLSPSTQDYIPQSYRNAITGRTIATTSANFAPRPTTSSSVPSPSYSQPPFPVASMPMHSPQMSTREEQGFAFRSAVPSVLHNQSHRIEGCQRERTTSMPCDPYLLNGIHSFDIFDMYGAARSGPETFYTGEELTGVPHHQVQGPSDDFPHLDIINSLFEDDSTVGKVGKRNGVLQVPNNRHNPLSRQFTFPGDSCVADGGLSATCCKFDHLGRFLDDGFGRMHLSSSGPYDGSRGVGTQVGRSGYMNDGQMDGMIQNQWQTHGPDLSLFRARNADDDGYPFPLPDYTNLACGVNGYPAFKPANGH